MWRWNSLAWVVSQLCGAGWLFHCARPIPRRRALPSGLRCHPRCTFRTKHLIIVVGPISSSYHYAYNNSFCCLQFSFSSSWRCSTNFWWSSWSFRYFYFSKIIDWNLSSSNFNMFSIVRSMCSFLRKRLLGCNCLSGFRLGSASKGKSATRGLWRSLDWLIYNSKRATSSGLDDFSFYFCKIFCSLSYSKIS